MEVVFDFFKKNPIPGHSWTFEKKLIMKHRFHIIHMNNINFL